RTLVVQCDARPLLPGELAALERDLSLQRAEQRRLAGSVRPGEREPVVPLDLEGNAVEERRARELLAEIGCDQDSHGPSLQSGTGSSKKSGARPDLPDAVRILGGERRSRLPRTRESRYCRPGCRTRTSNSFRSTRSGRSRWTPSRRRTRAIRERRWRLPRSPTCSTRRRCGTHLRTRTGRTATASS